MNNIAAAQSILLTPYGLSEGDLNAALGQMMRPDVDDADIFFQTQHAESWVLEEGIIKEGSYTIDSGYGLRVSSGEKTGYAFTNEFTSDALFDCAKAAASVVKQGASRVVNATKYSLSQHLYPSTNPLKSISDEDKIKALRELDRLARAQDPRVRQVMASLGARYEVVLMASPETGMTADIRPLVRMNITVVVEEGDRREQGSAGGGGRYDYEQLFKKGAVEHYAKEAVRQAVLNLDAEAAPAGVMPVVLGPGWPGVLLHEAVGHGLEGDFNRKKSSVFSESMGERVATSLCTVVDDGTVPGRRGSLNIDDEGTTMEKTVLIENGILKNYMMDKLNARLMGMRSTGNGRRESYAFQPIPRMTNTYMLPGEHTPEEIIASVDKGIYAVNFGGGQVDITSGKFVFSTSEAYLIEKGKIKHPIKGATLAGNGPDILTKVSMVGNNLELDPGIGVCGKDGQGVPVGVGQPTLLVDELVVGGTAS